MTAHAPPEATAVPATSLRLTRSIAATWWYTASAIMLLEVMLVVSWAATPLALGTRPGADATSTDATRTDATAAELHLLIVFVGGLIWLGITMPLLLRYRRSEPAAHTTHWRSLLAPIGVPLAVAAGYGVAAGIATGSWVIAVAPLAQALALLTWPPGIRLRIILAITALLIACAMIDFRSGLSLTPDPDPESSRLWVFVSAYSILLPVMTASSLWWWDVVVNLDRARAAEARLSATQERLRLATDVHDLQGHHLQVIALQLELTERLMARDPGAALEQLQAARLSVAAAQQGTRDLALQFQSVPLSDEIANAVDLLRAAGATVESSLSAGSDRAPASVLGPVIRETTTNALRHGGGKWVRLSLDRADGVWRYTMSNDSGAGSGSGSGSEFGAEAESGSAGTGSGINGIARRVAEAGGTVDVQRGKQEFAVVVTVPGGEF